MKKQARLVVVKSGKYRYLYIRWKGNDTELRVNTGKEFKSAAYHTVNLFFNSKFPNFKKENDDLKELLRKTNNYIRACRTANREPSNKELKNYLLGKILIGPNHPMYFGDTPHRINLDSAVSFFSLFKKFYSYKYASLGSKHSFKDYKSLLFLLMQYDKKESITINKLNSVDFMANLNYFLVENRKMHDNTIYKRLQTLRSFMYYLQESDVITFKKSAFKFKPKKYQSTQYALTPDEVKYLSSFSCITRFDQKIKDVFTILCHTGMSYSDITSINKDEIDFNSTPPTYTYIREKTREECIAPLSSIVIEILEKYNYDINAPSNQHFNREIKIILENTGEFDELIKKTHYQSGRKVISHEHKYNMIGSHSGRRTFVTNALAKGIGPNVVATVTGHKSIATINKYAKKVKDLSAFAE